MRLVLAMLFLIVCSCAAWAAQPAAPPQAPPPVAMSDFDRNVALGSILETRPGTQTEIEELRRFADRGLAAARAAVAKSPEAAEAQYTLASWLLYGYRVVSVEQMSYDPQGGARRVVVDRVVQGLTDDSTEGLGALKKATELAPNNTSYLLDYAAGLVDYDRGFEAETILKTIWSAGPPVTLQHKIRAGLLLSTITADDGDLEGAREWVYSALSLDSNLAEAVDRLRYLDAAQTAEMEYAPAWQPEEEEMWEGEAPVEPSEDYYEEPTPSEEQGYEEPAPGEGQGNNEYEEPQMGGEEGYEGVEPPAPPTGEEYGVEPPEPPTEPSGDEGYYEEPSVPEPPEPPAPPTGDEYGSGYVEPPSNQPGINEEPPGNEESPPGEVPGY